MSIILSRLSQRLKPIASGLIKFKQSPPLTKANIRKSGNYVPRNQYDIPLPPMFNDVFNLMVHRYELIPLMIIVVLDIVMTIGFVIYFINNKTDIVIFGEWRDYISRTMNLRAPTIHKLYPVTMKNYEPWCEMQKVLDRMAFAEFMKQNTLCTSLSGN